MEDIVLIKINAFLRLNRHVPVVFKTSGSKEIRILFFISTTLIPNLKYNGNTNKFQNEALTYHTY